MDGWMAQFDVCVCRRGRHELRMPFASAGEAGERLQAWRAKERTVRKEGRERAHSPQSVQRERGESGLEAAWTAGWRESGLEAAWTHGEKESGLEAACTFCEVLRAASRPR